MAKWKMAGGVRYRYNEGTGEVLARAEPIFVCTTENEEAQCPHRVNFDAPYKIPLGEKAWVEGQPCVNRYIDRASAMRAVEEAYP